MAKEIRKMLQQHLVKGYLKFTKTEQETLLTCMWWTWGTNIHSTYESKRSLMSVLLRFVLFSSINFSLFFLAGIRSWDVDLKCCDLDEQLQLFITRHSAHFSSEVRGQCDVAAYPEQSIQYTAESLWNRFGQNSH